MLLFAFVLDVTAQEPSPSAQSTSQSDQQETPEPNQTKRKRRRATRSASYQGRGVLELEYAYNGDFFSNDAPDAQAFTLTLTYSVTNKLQLEFSSDNFVTQTDSNNLRSNGLGNTYLGFQYTLQSEAKNRPSLALAYQITLPTGSEGKGISNGRTLHALEGIVSKQVNKIDIDLNFGMLLNGRQGQKNFDKGLLLGLGFSRDLKKGFGVQWEVSGQTLNASEPKGVFASSSITYQKSPRSQFDFGLRVGLTPAAPRFGVFTGWTFTFPSFEK